MSKSLYYAVDLHIHTALSPCASDEMTPKNIVRASLDAGLNAIAITDHNSCLNLEAVLAQAKNTDLVVVPGIEVESREGVHLLTLFKDLTRCQEWGSLVLDKLAKQANNINYFGNQLHFSQDGIRQFPILLAQAISLSIDDIYQTVSSLGGIVIPAHIYRKYNGILSVLGMMPDNINFNLVEISRRVYKKNLYKAKDIIIVNSDAHSLSDIYKSPSTALKLKNNSASEIIEILKHQCLKDSIFIY